MVLVRGYNAIRWQAATQLIAVVPCIALVSIVYTDNPNTGAGYLTYQPGDLLSNMQRFVQGRDYLVLMLDACELLGAVAAPVGAFKDFPGYIAPTPDIAPVLPVGRTEIGVAGEPILGGRLVAQTPIGLRHYSSAILEHEHFLFGVALNSALVGGSVSVRRPGYVRYDGWGLPPGALLLAGADGRLVTQVSATSFYQVIGRALSSDELLYQPETVVILSNPQTTS